MAAAQRNQKKGHGFPVSKSMQYLPENWKFNSIEKRKSNQVTMMLPELKMATNDHNLRLPEKFKSGKSVNENTESP